MPSNVPCLLDEAVLDEAVLEEKERLARGAGPVFCDIFLAVLTRGQAPRRSSFPHERSAAEPIRHGSRDRAEAQNGSSR